MHQTRFWFRFRFTFWYMSEPPFPCNTWTLWRPPLNNFKKRFLLFPGTDCRDVVGVNLVHNKFEFTERPHDTYTCDCDYIISQLIHSQVTWIRWCTLIWQYEVWTSKVPGTSLTPDSDSHTCSWTFCHPHSLEWTTTIMVWSCSSSVTTVVYVVGYYLSHYENSVDAYTRHTCGGDGWVGTAVLPL